LLYRYSPLQHTVFYISFTFNLMHFKGAFSQEKLWG
jgi:hypothetical protein